MRKVFLRYFLSIFAIAVVVLLVQFGMLFLQYGVSQEQWKAKVYDDFVVSVQDSINDGTMAGYGLNSILYAVSNIEDDRISGFILRDISGTNVVAFGRTSEGRNLTSMPLGQSRTDTGHGESKVSKATRIDVKSEFNAMTNTLSLVSVTSTETKGVEISLPANLKNEGIIGSVVIAVDGTDAFIIDLEDSVKQENKETALAEVIRFLDGCSGNDKKIFIRLNKDRVGEECEALSPVSERIAKHLDL